MTAVANATFTAAQFNLYVRDNLNETAPAKATVAGQLFVSTAANAIAARTPDADAVATSQGTTSTSYTDLATAGPAVTVTTGVSAIVFLRANISNATATNVSSMCYAVSGATTVAAADTNSISLVNSGTAAGNRFGAAFFHESLTPGSNTFTAKYKSSGVTTATFADRQLAVIPL